MRESHCLLRLKQLLSILSLSFLASTRIKMLIIINVLLVLMTSINAVITEPDSLIKSGFQSHLFKCCPEGKYVGKKKSCVSYNKTLSFSSINIYDKEMKATGKSLEDVFSFNASKFRDTPFRKEVLDVTLLDFNTFVIESGVLQLELPNAYNRWTPIAPSNYCVDYRIMADPKKITPRFWAILPGGDFVKSNPIFTYATLLSCFFMLLVLIVYFLLPELQNLCGLILMAYVFSLFMAFLLLAIIQIQLHSPTGCIFLTMFIYFFFLATFCWMSVMSYDIWWTFRGYAKARPIHRRGEVFKFLMYCLFAFGVPFLMTVGLYTLNTVKNDLRHIPWFITPHIPEFGCFLEGGIKLLYLYTPMLILIICNWMFYLMTAFNIWRLSRGTAVLDSAAAGNPQAHRTHRHRFMVYLKLSVVMGLNWFLEIVSFLYPAVKIWVIFDIYNILIGLAIFLIFVCKKKILRKLCKRYLGRQTMRWYPSSKSYSQSSSVSDQESATLQSKVSSQPNGLNGYAMVSKKSMD